MALHLFRPGYIRASHATRLGACRRCGACCRLTVVCPHVCEEDGVASCNRHKQTRLPNCVNFRSTDGIWPTATASPRTNRAVIRGRNLPDVRPTNC